MSSHDFIEELAAPTPTPGGGAAAAYAGRLAAALLRMVVGITIEKTEPRDAGPLRELLAEAERLSERFRRLGAEDAAAFRAYIEAGRMPRATPEEKEARRQAREMALVGASEVPLQILDAAVETAALARRARELSRATGLKAESDLLAAVELVTATFRVAELNLDANLPLVAAEVAAALRRRWLDARKSFEDLRGSFPSLRGEGGTAG